MSSSVRVEAYLESLGGAAACDRCISDAFAALAPWSANLAARRLACIDAAERARERCGSCGAKMLVTRTRQAVPQAHR
ncbi:hypothetical protein [Sphingopyxis fribergensis]